MNEINVPLDTIPVRGNLKIDDRTELIVPSQIAGNGYYAPQNIDAYAKYTKQPAELLRKADRYDFKPDLRIDQGTLEDMQREFVAQGILTYKQPLNEVRLVARF